MMWKTSENCDMAGKKAICFEPYSFILFAKCLGFSVALISYNYIIIYLQTPGSKRYN